MTERKIPVRTEYIKLDQFLKLAGVCRSGGEAKEQILSGKVLVNGEICMMRGRKIRPGDRIETAERVFLPVSENEPAS